MLALLLALLQSPSPPKAVDFFPVVPGTVRTFTDGTSETTTDEVEAPVDIGGTLATPIVGRDGRKRVISTSYYRIDGDTVYLVGYDVKHPLPRAMPILQFNGKPGKWLFDGGASDAQDAEALHLSGETKLLRDRLVFGQKRATIQVTIRAEIGGGPSGEHDEQVAIYAQGVGLIELTSKAKVGRDSNTTIRRLEKVEEAK